MQRGDWSAMEMDVDDAHDVEVLSGRTKKAAPRNRSQQSSARFKRSRRANGISLGISARGSRRSTYRSLNWGKVPPAQQSSTET